MPPLAFGGHDFRVAGGAALFWPLHNALILADLHLEKGSAFAVHGQMLPPHDSLETLDRIAQLIDATGADTVWCLGDNFHDENGPARMPDATAERLSTLVGRVDWHWITGNHDEQLPSGIGGAIVDEAELDGLILRHRADPKDLRPELSGHFHPKHRVTARGRSVSRPCFVEGASKLILPAFGAFTGGLAASHHEIAMAVGAYRSALVPTATAVLRFVL